MASIVYFQSVCFQILWWLFLVKLIVQLCVFLVHLRTDAANEPPVRANIPHLVLPALPKCMFIDESKNYDYKKKKKNSLNLKLKH